MLDWQSGAYVPFSVKFKMCYSNEKSVSRKRSQLLRRGGRFQEVPNKELRPGTFKYFGKLVPQRRWSEPEVRLYYI